MRHKQSRPPVGGILHQRTSSYSPKDHWGTCHTKMTTCHEATWCTLRRHAGARQCASYYGMSMAPHHHCIFWRQSSVSSVIRRLDVDRDLDASRSASTRHLWMCMYCFINILDRARRASGGLACYLKKNLASRLISGGSLFQGPFCG